MLSTALGFPGDMSHCSVLALEDPGFSQGLLPPWSQSVLWNWVWKCTFEYYKKYEVKMTLYYLSLLFTHLVKEPWRTGGWNQKYLGNRLLVIWFFWLHMIIYDYCFRAGVRQVFTTQRPFPREIPLTMKTATSTENCTFPDQVAICHLWNLFWNLWRQTNLYSRKK